jgi:hypothetical protein
MLPDKFHGIELNRRQYYLGCMNDYDKSARQGVHRSEDLTALLAALDREPSEIKKWVKRTRLYTAASRPPGGVTERVATKMTTLAPDPLPAFDTVFDAMAWDDANPREPAESSFLDLQGYGVEDVKKVKRGRLRQLRRMVGHVPFFNRTVARVNALRANRA